MTEYKLEIKQIVDYPKCRVYRQFIQSLITDRNIRTNGCSGLFHYVVLCCYANFRTSYQRYDGISYIVHPGQGSCGCGSARERIVSFCGSLILSSAITSSSMT